MLRALAVGGLILVLLAALTLVVYGLTRKRQAASSSENEVRSVFLEFDGLDYQLQSKASTVAEIIAENSLEVGEDDFVFPQMSEKIAPEAKIIVRRRVPVTIKVDGREIKTKTFAKTVAEVLEEEGIVLNHPDIIKPEKHAALSRGEEIEVTRINIEDVTEEEEIEFATQEKEDNTLAWRKTKTGQEGEKGIRAVTYRITYTDGKETSRKKIATEIIKNPVPKIILKGTKIIVGKVSKGRASWYSFTGDLKCASLEHPIGTWLRVTNTANGRSVIVQVNDRGPFVPDKIIDLDKVAFKKIGDIGQGVIPVKVEEIKMD